MYDRIESVDGESEKQFGESKNFYDRIGSTAKEISPAGGYLKVKVGKAILVYTKQENRDLRRHMMKIYDAKQNNYINIGPIIEYDGEINYVELLHHEPGGTYSYLPVKRDNYTGKMVDIEEGDMFIMDGHTVVE